MPLLVMHGGKPPVAVANKTPAAQVVPTRTNPNADALDKILNKLSAIEMELGITPPQEVQLSEEEIVKRQAFAEKMKMAREMRQAEAEQKRKDFLKRMQKGKKKAARSRGE